MNERVRDGRRGGALVAVVLLLIAATGLAHTVLLTVRYEARIAAASVRLLERSAAADAAVGHAFRRNAPELDTIAVGSSAGPIRRTFGHVTTQLWRRRVSDEIWLWEVGARHDGGGTSRSATAAWRLDPERRVADLPTALTVGESDPRRGGAGIVTEIDTPGAPCGPGLPAGSLALAVTLVPDSLQPALGLLDLQALVDLGLGLPPSVAPGPGAAGVCAASTPDNWGAPDRPGHPCHTYRPVLGRVGDLEVAGGTGQGVLVVTGDLVMRRGSRFYGVVLVAGAVSLEDGSRIHGRLWAHRGLTVHPTARLVGSRCWAVHALSATTPALSVPVVLREPIGPL